MIFSELYSAYYNAVARILKTAADHPLSSGELRSIINETAFAESILTVGPALTGGGWQLLHPDGTTPLLHPPSMPLTLLEKRFIKAISLDPRIRLFADEFEAPDDVEPLFTPADYEVFDRYADGDPFEDGTYIRNFRLILDAVRKQYPLAVETKTHAGNRVRAVLQPESIEYSEKDDKYRFVGKGCRTASTVNLARIVSCERYTKPFKASETRRRENESRTVVFELYDRRKALERVLMHFAHFEKEAEKLGEDKYLVTVHYDASDETELVIRVLSFGPMIKVVSPQDFVGLIKERLQKQKSCEL